MSDYPDFRPWDVIERERARRDFGIAMTWGAIVSLVVAVGLAALMLPGLAIEVVR